MLTLPHPPLQLQLVLDSARSPTLDRSAPCIVWRVINELQLNITARVQAVVNGPVMQPSSYAQVLVIGPRFPLSV